MTKYEDLMRRADECAKKAAGTNDGDLKTFYYNASEGYKIKAAKLTIEEAGEQVC